MLQKQILFNVVKEKYIAKTKNLEKSHTFK